MILKLKTYEWPDRLQATGMLQQEALVELRDILLRGLISAFKRRGVSVAFCEDVTQETLIKILTKLHTFKGNSKFTTWAMSIAVRTGISHLRKRKLRCVSLEAAVDDGLRLDIPDKRSGQPELPQLKTAILEKLQELIDSELTEKQKTVVKAMLNGMPVDVIASRTGSNRNAIYKMLHDARNNLRKGFEATDISVVDLAEAFPSGI